MSIPLPSVEPSAGSPASRVLVVVVNYRTGRLVVNCLRSLEQEVKDVPGTTVTVVDNASGDGSAATIRDAIVRNGWQDWATLIESDTNGGFAHGNNIAIRPALASPQPPDHVWLLNPDAEARPGALRALVEFVEANPRVGIAGSRLESPTGQTWPYVFRFPSGWSELDDGLRLGLASRLLASKALLRRVGDGPVQADWVSGGSFFIRRQVFESIGLLDEGYFLYFEETDFCLHAIRAGWQTWLVPASRVMHDSGQSTGITGRAASTTRRPAYWFESRRRYFVKNHGRAKAAFIDAVWIASFGLYRVREWLQRKPAANAPRFWRDFIRHSALFNSGIPESPVVSHGVTQLARTQG